MTIVKRPTDYTGWSRRERVIGTAGGTIALHAHDPNSTVYYKNIRIKPLD